VAAWWVVLVGFVLITVQWIAYLVIVPAQPAWYLSLWGPGVTWREVQEVWLNAMVKLKLGLFAGASLALWLTLWSRRIPR
jgi:hypothetical protein